MASCCRPAPHRCACFGPPVGHQGHPVTTACHSAPGPRVTPPHCGGCCAAAHAPPLLLLLLLGRLLLPAAGHHLSSGHPSHAAAAGAAAGARHHPLHPSHHLRQHLQRPQLLLHPTPLSPHRLLQQATAPHLLAKLSLLPGCCCCCRRWGWVGPGGPLPWRAALPPPAGCPHPRLTHSAAVLPEHTGGGRPDGVEGSVYVRSG